MRFLLGSRNPSTQRFKLTWKRSCNQGAQRFRRLYKVIGAPSLKQKASPLQKCGLSQDVHGIVAKLWWAATEGGKGGGGENTYKENESKGGGRIEIWEGHCCRGRIIRKPPEETKHHTHKSNTHTQNTRVHKESLMKTFLYGIYRFIVVQTDGIKSSLQTRATEKEHLLFIRLPLLVKILLHLKTNKTLISTRLSRLHINALERNVFSLFSSFNRSCCLQFE